MIDSKSESQLRSENEFASEEMQGEETKITMTPEEAQALIRGDVETRKKYKLGPKLLLSNGDPVTVVIGQGENNANITIEGHVVGVARRHVWDAYIVNCENHPFGEQYPYQCIVFEESQLVPHRNAKPRLVIANSIPDVPGQQKLFASE